MPSEHLLRSHGTSSIENDGLDTRDVVFILGVLVLRMLHNILRLTGLDRSSDLSDVAYWEGDMALPIQKVPDNAAKRVEYFCDHFDVLDLLSRPDHSQHLELDTRFLNADRFERHADTRPVGGKAVLSITSEGFRLHSLEYLGIVYSPKSIPSKVVDAFLAGLQMYLTVCTHATGAHFRSSAVVHEACRTHLPDDHLLYRVLLPTLLGTRHGVARAIIALLDSGGSFVRKYALTYNGLEALVNEYLLKRRAHEFNLGLVGRDGFATHLRLTDDERKTPLFAAYIQWYQALRAFATTVTEHLDTRNDRHIRNWASACLGQSKEDDVTDEAITQLITFANFAQLSPPRPMRGTRPDFTLTIRHLTCTTSMATRGAWIRLVDVDLATVVENQNIVEAWSSLLENIRAIEYPQLLAAADIEASTFL